MPLFSAKKYLFFISSRKKYARRRPPKSEKCANLQTCSRRYPTPLAANISSLEPKISLFYKLFNGSKLDIITSRGAEHGPQLVQIFLKKINIFYKNLTNFFQNYKHFRLFHVNLLGFSKNLDKFRDASTLQAKSLFQNLKIDYFCMKCACYKP